MGLAQKSMLAVLEVMWHPALTRKLLAQAYNERIVRRGAVPTVDLQTIIGTVPEIRLANFVPEHGNVSAFELLCLCMFVRAFKPIELLELGTFNGNTTLQLAANVGEGAKVTTFDLPAGALPSAANNQHDAVLVNAVSRLQLRFSGTVYADRISQRFGDTLDTDFADLTATKPDFIFIDAGHTDECVRNDTLKALAVLRSGGMIVWHDYTQDWPDVFSYLNELGQQLPLEHVAGTNLVVYRSPRPLNG